METMRTATFKFRTLSRANDLFDKVDYMTTETITERDGGLQVDSHAVGVCDGERVNDRSSKFHPGANFDNACEYRHTHGYSEVRS